MCILMGRNGVKDVYNEKHFKEKSYDFMLKELIMAGTDLINFFFQAGKMLKSFLCQK